MRSIADSTRLRTGIGLLAGILLATGAIVPRAIATDRAASGTLVDWLTYGGSLSRTGENPNETVLTPTTVGSLSQKWTYKLAGALSNPPVEAAAVSTPSGSRDLVFVGDERGNFVALDEHTGQLVWKRNLGGETTTCNLLPSDQYGITAAAVIDRLSNRIYEIGGTGRLYALVLGTGAVVPGWPVVLTTSPTHDYAWGALGLTGGSIYAVMGSGCDNAPYHGRVVEVSTGTPAIVATFYVTPTTGASGGAIWGWGGASVDVGAGAVYAATGNAIGTPQNAGYSEAVLRLTTALGLVAYNQPPLLPGSDLDFGSTPVLFQVAGCPTQLAVQNKDGALFLYDRNSIGSGPVQSVQVLPSTSPLPFVGLPAWSDATQMLYVSNDVDSSSFKHGMIAFSETAPSCTLTERWNTVNGPTHVNEPSPPTVAGDVVYNGDGKGNQVFAYNATTGALLWSSGTSITGPAFSPPTVVNGMVFVASWDHELHAYGL